MNMELTSPICRVGCRLELESQGEHMFQFKGCQAGRADVADEVQRQAAAQFSYSGRVFLFYSVLLRRKSTHICRTTCFTPLIKILISSNRKNNV